MRSSVMLLAAALLFGTGCARGAPGGTGIEVGMRPVSYVLPRLGGGSDALAVHRGHVVLLDLWASWCEPCREELPALSTLAATQPHLVVLAANQGETADVAAGIVRRLHLRMPVLLDRDQRYGEAYATIGLPTAVVLRANGTIAAVETGSYSLSQWRAKLAQAGLR